MCWHVEVIEDFCSTLMLRQFKIRNSGGVLTGSPCANLTESLDFTLKLCFLKIGKWRVQGSISK